MGSEACLGQISSESPERDRGKARRLSSSTVGNEVVVTKYKITATVSLFRGVLARFAAATAAAAHLSAASDRIRDSVSETCDVREVSSHFHSAVPSIDFEPDRKENGGMRVLRSQLRFRVSP